MNKRIILNYLGDKLRDLFKVISDEEFNHIQEIRIRVNNPIIVKSNSYFTFSNNIKSYDLENGYRITNLDIERIIEKISQYSLYAYDYELKNGYITLPYGNRIGITGKTVIENNKVKTIKNVSSINIRIAHEIKGCSEKVYRIISENTLGHTMIISPPACGKTTLLRDLIRLTSNGYYEFSGVNVGVVDERSEISGCYKGVPQNDLGIRTDVLDSCPKSIGMILLLRSMNPSVIAVDEIGKKKDIKAINEIINAGITLFCTVHGSSIEDVKQKPFLGELINRKLFKYYIVLSREKTGEIEGIYNSDFIEKW